MVPKRWNGYVIHASLSEIQAKLWIIGFSAPLHKGEQGALISFIIPIKYQKSTFKTTQLFCKFLILVKRMTRSLMEKDCFQVMNS